MRACLRFASTRVSSGVAALNGARPLEVISHVCSANVSKHSPVVEFQTLQVQSSDNVSTKASSEENIAELTLASCSIKVCKHSPVVDLQVFAVPSLEAVSAEVPSDENIAELTLASCSSVTTHAAVVASHIFAVLSREAVNANLSSGEKTASMYAVFVTRHCA